MLKFVSKSTKYRKYHKGPLPNKICSKQLYFRGRTFFLGLKVLTPGRLPNNQLISFFNSINKNIKKAGKIRLNFISNLPVTKKPIETRMGKGKGNLASWVSKIQAGSILCELNTSSILLGINALSIAKKKLSLKTKIIHNLK